MKAKIIAIDFDGTLCESAWPAIGAPKQTVIDHILNQQRVGCKLILWTNRTGQSLTEAVEWCRQRGIVFDAINDNLPEMIAAFDNNCRKVYADEYIDDKAVPVSVIESGEASVKVTTGNITRQKLTRLNGRNHS